MRDAMLAQKREKALERIVTATQALGERFGCADKAREIALVPGREPVRSMRRLGVIADVLETILAEADAYKVSKAVGKKKAADGEAS